MFNKKKIQKESNPAMKIELTKYDKVIEALTFFLLIVYWFLIIIFFKDLPSEIPTHIDASGKINSYGPKETVFISPIFCLILYIFLSLVIRNPKMYFSLKNFTTQNLEKSLNEISKYIRIFRLSIIAIAFTSDYFKIQVSLDVNKKFQPWLVPTIFLLLIILAIFFKINLNNNQKK